MGIKCIFICTSNKDLSVALENYFREVYPENEYKSAGINSYFCKLHGTHLITKEDLDWADLVVYAENIHFHYVISKYGSVSKRQDVILNCGEYKPDSCLADDYLQNADVKLSHYLHNSKNIQS